MEENKILRNEILDWLQTTEKPFTKGRILYGKISTNRWFLQELLRAEAEEKPDSPLIYEYRSRMIFKFKAWLNPREYAGRPEKNMDIRRYPKIHMPNKAVSRDLIENIRQWDKHHNYKQGLLLLGKVTRKYRLLAELQKHNARNETKLIHELQQALKEHDFPALTSHSYEPAAADQDLKVKQTT
jgi:hypothetical protein